jgi:hypothetical protein
MFGYVVADVLKLEKEEKKEYGAYYCGLCRTLGKSLGITAKLTLNYDMTFLYLFLDGYFDSPRGTGFIRCGLHPLRKKQVFFSEFSLYCACMTVILAYYKLEDDVNDENSLPAKCGKKMLENAFLKAKSLFPEKADAIKTHLDNLSKIEADDVHIPDIPAKEFGAIMGKIFDINGNDSALYSFGEALGRTIYIMDACNDLKSDLKKMKYNPMVETPTKNFQQILTMLMGETTQIYDTMNITKNRQLIENILYLGIWSKNRRKNN